MLYQGNEDGTVNYGFRRGRLKLSNHPSGCFEATSNLLLPYGIVSRKQ